MKTIQEFITLANRLITAKAQDRITLVQAKEALLFLGSKYQGEYKPVVMGQISSVNGLNDADQWVNWAMNMTSLNLNSYSDEEQFKLLPEGSDVSFICINEMTQKFGKKVANGVMADGHLYKSRDMIYLSFEQTA